MKYCLLLTRALSITATIFLMVTVTNGNCTPVGTHIRDVSSGACGSTGPQFNTLTKEGLWYITWPDGAYDELTAIGGGLCSWQSRCETLPVLDSIYCWPDFYPPVGTPSGGFSILVVNKGIDSVTRRCGLSIFVETRRSCRKRDELPSTRLIRAPGAVVDASLASVMKARTGTPSAAVARVTALKVVI